MRIAITVQTDRGLLSPVSRPVGRSPFYAFADLEGDEINHLSIVENPHLKHHDHHAIASFIKDHEAEVLISGGGGKHVRELFQRLGVARATGASGTLMEAVIAYLAGELGTDDDDAGCGCGHHHHSTGSAESLEPR